MGRPEPDGITARRDLIRGASTGSSGLLDAAVRGRLERHLHSALTRARRSGRGGLASVTCPAPSGLDPVALVAASRRPGESWFCLEQPDRHGYAVAGLGAAWAMDAAGEDRFRVVAGRWRAVSAAAVADPVGEGPAGSGLVAMGGFAFADQGSAAPQWDGYQPASLLVPELAAARGAAGCALTVNVAVAPDDALEGLLERVECRLAGVRSSPLPLLDPAPVGVPRVQSTMPPAHYEAAVDAAVRRIRNGELEKLVLAREVEVLAAQAHDPAAVLGLLREEFRSCYVFAVGRGDATFLGASPELLVRREGQRASTVALAGSIGRSADPAVDDHLGERLLRSDKDREENAIVARRIVRALRPHSVWVTAAPEPTLVRVANIQHLARPVRAQLASAAGAVELAGALHPTPAVGGEPHRRALELIPALEGLDRGWYGGALGWVDAAGDGELCVALRCALLRGPAARLFAGCGIVADSDPAAELAETEVKLAALLPVLAG